MRFLGQAFDIDWYEKLFAQATIMNVNIVLKPYIGKYGLESIDCRVQIPIVTCLCTNKVGIDIKNWFGCLPKILLPIIKNGSGYVCYHSLITNYHSMICLFEHNNRMQYMIKITLKRMRVSKTKSCHINMEICTIWLMDECASVCMWKHGDMMKNTSYIVP